MERSRKSNVKKMVTLAMLAAIAYIIVMVVRIPVVMFLKYEPKDVVITIGGFLFGPAASLITSLVVSLVEMVTISDTGPIGAIMNFLSTCSFACVAAFYYKKHRTMTGAVTGLAMGSVLMIIIMLLWNWLITPLYMGVPREQVQGMLIPVFLPFNALKAGLNTAITLVIYKPVVSALRKVHLVDDRASQQSDLRLGIYLMAGLLLITCIILVLVFNGTI